jgi:hypothetical protein
MTFKFHRNHKGGRIQRSPLLSNKSAETNKPFYTNAFSSTYTISNGIAVIMYTEIIMYPILSIIILDNKLLIVY